jgi:hypothetical protein
MRFKLFLASTKESIMAKMTKNQLIDAIAEGTQVSKGDVKAVIEQMAIAANKPMIIRPHSSTERRMEAVNCRIA